MFHSFFHLRCMGTMSGQLLCPSSSSMRTPPHCGARFLAALQALLRLVASQANTRAPHVVCNGTKRKCAWPPAISHRGSSGFNLS